ncbi:class I SAM-dependent methyltransferase [Paenibacillus pinisoli]|uniref:Class I SAM-dependent methyltransferase n=1 Tax=Paenibacillus pinisoli TaxID=1276110 RepID=A0A3A6PAE0_9BACL|nr:class I SAM-dependent methyltransferase [Paenibacillus pinisoli]RJX36955.1 class I SAM-dependent methyltransferase [Paenibacillus pinisoli]
MNLKRIYAENVHIDQNSLQEFYKKRAVEKVQIDVDAPVILFADKDKDKIEAWTRFEVEHRLPLLNLDRNCSVLEVGCGTGRISKYITSIVDTYVGVDYVKEFIELIQKREDVVKNENTHFLHASIQELSNETVQYPTDKKFNRFIISGGVLMYINDDAVKEAFSKLTEKLEEECIIYLSEPIALEERLTLNKFYSDALESEYSAIYRTEEQYKEIFNILYDVGFELKVSEEFFFEDIKNQKETKQWIFILQRSKNQSQAARGSI